MSRERHKTTRKELMKFYEWFKSITEDKGEPDYGYDHLELIKGGIRTGICLFISPHEGDSELYLNARRMTHQYIPYHLIGYHDYVTIDKLFLRNYSYDDMVHQVRVWYQYIMTAYEQLALKVKQDYEVLQTIDIPRIDDFAEGEAFVKDAVSKYQATCLFPDKEGVYVHSSCSGHLRSTSYSPSTCCGALDPDPRYDD